MITTPSFTTTRTPFTVPGRSQHDLERVHGTNFFPTNQAAVGFTDPANHNYALSGASPYRNAGTDGLDIGADIAAVTAATAGVVRN